MRPLIHLLLILTFVVQPASTLADVHQFHQSGVEHLGFEGDRHADDHLTPGVADTDKNFGTQLDCHHCCHCHGVACCVGLPVAHALEFEYGTFIQKNDYAARVYPSVHEKQFRPPRV